MGKDPRDGSLDARNTTRARQLRNTVTPAERHFWPYLSPSRLSTKFSR